MPLRIPNPPAQGMEIIRDALSSAIRQPGAAAAAVNEATSATNLTTAAPHQVYFVGLREIAAGRLLEAARLTGWRYIIFDGEQALAAAELNVNPDSQQLDFSNINRAPFVASSVEAVARAERLEVVRDEDFELRLLDIPSLYVVALWLHGARDLIIPLPPTRPELQPFSVYSEEEVIARLSAAAVERLKFDERPRA